MKTDSSYFLDFIENSQQFRIPIYQRKYSWEIKHCEKLFNDIKNIGESEKESHFMGSFVFKPDRDGVPILNIIDGQQRITTMSLLLAALSTYLINNSEYADQNNMDAESIMTSYIFNSNYYYNPKKREDLKYKLVLTEDDDINYKRIIDDILPAGELKIIDKHNRLYKIYEYFYEKIGEENFKSLWNGIEKITIVTLDLEEADPAQAIFESLNHTGKKLDSTDLIRNYLLMDLTTKKQERIYNSHWKKIEEVFEDSDEEFDEFIKHYLNVYEKGIDGDTYENFKSFKTEKYPNDDVEKLVEDVEKYCRYFEKIVLGDEKDKKLKKAFKSINQLPYKIVRPFLFKLYDDYRNNDLNVDDFIQIIKYAESFLLRRAVCARDSQSLKGFFVKKVKQINKEHYVDSFKYLLTSTTGKSTMPNDEEFENFFKTRDLYNTRINKYVLLKLTNHNHKETTDMDEVSIEHVLPKSPNLPKAWQEELGEEDWKNIQKEYVHRIGNLTLVNKGLNSKLGKKSYQEKKTMEDGYNDSPINLNTYFEDIEHWNKEEIETRSDVLFKDAKEIWEYPFLTDEEIRKILRNEKETTLDGVFSHEEEEEEEEEIIPNDNQRYWDRCKTKIDKYYPIFNSTKPSKRNDYRLAIKSIKAIIRLSINLKEDFVTSELYIKDEELFNYLKSLKNEIDTELKYDFIWENPEDTKKSTISITKNYNLKEDVHWDEPIIWQLDVAKNLYDVFYDRIQKFKK